MAVSRRTAKLLAKAARVIQGHATRGSWVEIPASAMTGDPSDGGFRTYGRGSEDYERLKKDIALAKKNHPNEIPCNMCTEGAIVMACAQEGLSHTDMYQTLVEANQVYRDAGVRLNGMAVDIPSWNDNQHNTDTIEQTLEEVAEWAKENTA